jgi:hypothetical protein
MKGDHVLLAVYLHQHLNEITDFFRSLEHLRRLCTTD